MGPEKTDQLRSVVAGCIAFALLGACASARHTHAVAPAQGADTASIVAVPAPLPTISCPRTLSQTRLSGSSDISLHADTESGFSTCRYRFLSPAPGGCTAATVTIDSAPQSLTDYSRWFVVTARNAALFPGSGRAPRHISGVGSRAAWVPATLTFEAATSYRWVAVNLHCLSSERAAALARHLAIAALDAP